MVAYCSSCKRYVNQYCERCHGNYGITICKQFACGGRMICPLCKGSDLASKRESVPDPYNFSTNKIRTIPKADLQKDPKQSGYQCPSCGQNLKEVWKYCPECGVPLKK